MLLPTTTGNDSFGHFIEYQLASINYLRIRMYDDRSSSSSEYYQDRSIWRVWDQSGNLYTFAARMEYINYGIQPAPIGEIYKWFISSAKSVTGKEYIFNYAKTTVYRNDGLIINGIRYDICGNCSSTTVAEMYLDNIQYPDNSYYVHFERQDRQDYSKACYESVYARCFADKKRLSSITVYYNPDRDVIAHSPNNDADTFAHSGIQPVRKYVLTYAAEDNSGAAQRVFPGVHWQDANVPGYTTPGYVTTLLKITEKGKDDGALPETTFTYDQIHLTEVNNGYNGKVVFEYEADPWAPNAANFYPSTWNFRDSGMNWNGTAAWYSYGPVNEGSFGPGKMLWLRIGAANRGETGLTVHTGLTLPDGRYIESSSQNMTASTTPLDYYFSIKLPADMPKTEGGNQYYVQFWCGAPLPGTHCEMGSVQWGMMPSFYRVTKRKVYPQAVDFANPTNPNLPHDDYTYQYTGATLNPSNTVLTQSQYDDASLRQLHKPYSEFRGHSQVTVTQPDGSIIVYSFNQSERLSGRLSSVALYRGLNQAKLSETIYTYTTPIQISSVGVDDQLPKYRIEPNAYVYQDAQIWWVDTASVEKWTHSESTPVKSIATKSETGYRYDAGGKPVYGEVRSVVESENNGNGWTVVRKKFSTYTATDVNTSTRYFVGHPSSTAVCSPNGSETNAEYQICGSNANDYYGFTSYVYNSLGQVSETVNLLNYSGTPTSAYGDFTRYSYDPTYGYLWKVEQGYKDQNTDGIIQKTTEYCYKAETTGATPECVDYTGAGVNGVYLSWVKNALNQVTHYVNDPQLGLPTKQIDPNLAETTVTYDEFGRLMTVQKPGETGTVPTLQFAYNPPTTAIPYFWTEATQKLADSGIYTGLRVRKFYNGLGELIQTQQTGRTTQGAQTEDGLPVNSAACGTTCMIVTDQKTAYISSVKTTTQTMPYAVTAQTGYVTPTWANATVTTYDVLGRPVTISAPDQTASSFSYEVEQVSSNPIQYRQRIKTTDAENHNTYSWKDAWGRTVKVQPATGPWLEYGYDAADRLTVVQQFPFGGSTAFATTTISYDAAGRKTQMVDPDMGTWNYTYDAAGNMVTQSDAKQQTLWFGYDLLNRLVEKRATNASGTLLASYGYDQGDNGIGRRSSMNAGDGTLQSLWSYDARGRVTQQTDLIPGIGVYTTLRSYDSADRVTSMTYPSGEVVNYTNLPQGAVSQVTSNQAVYLGGASYDASGRARQRLLGNGVENIWNYNAWNEINQGGRLNAAQAYKTGTTPITYIQNLAYTGYDKVGNLTALSDIAASETLSFTYDALNRLDAVSGAYSDNPEYDAHGNLSQKTGPNGAISLIYPGGATRPHAVQSTQIQGIPSSSYGYDANGNMDQRIVGGVTYILSYDIENRLTAISGGGLSASYAYNADGARIKAVITTNGGTRTTGYVGDYFEISVGQPRPGTPNCALPRRCAFVPLVSSGIVLSPGQAWYSYYYAGASRIALRIKSNQLNLNDGVFYFLSDHLGGTAITLNDSDAKTAELRYTAWGETRYTSGSTPTQRRYTGQLEAETGLYFYNARWYDAALGRFAQADTIIPEPGSSWDRYAGMRNNPVRYNDPSGHCVWDFCVGEIMLFIGVSAPTVAWVMLNADAITNATIGLVGAVAGGLAAAGDIEKKDYQAAALDIAVGVGGAGVAGISASSMIPIEGVQNTTAASGSATFMSPSDRFVKNVQNTAPEPGYYDVVAHGTPNSIEIGGQPVDHRVAAKLIQSQPDYAGQPIRLLSCSTGKCANGFAKNLANKMGVDVMAPDDLLWAWPDGRLTIGPTSRQNTGSWKPFSLGEEDYESR